ncbi:hypothetical protein DBR00_04790 [Pseudomonas sp. HMWF032]|uniref:hypothetical protein n=1 Tax=unclassified Pseudomonas TaxID=196821 RepID=UPI000D38CDAC|nr:MULTISPECIES: hypothetical protein [unclassified Pseudomonas]PTS85119.1 hypothetical protein DBR00_04790 [Pseudomonas sp. HMWF032]PTT86237.1 hypothetical protein DBR41_00940 [Pseudomonas sp. HMWF010]WAC42762.1 hypothetical protein OU997_10620 [Pseudomonas sp. SL4(2022)]
MDEFNPYAPPAAHPAAELPSRPSGYRLYLACNLLYAALTFVALLMLLSGGRIRLAVTDLLVVGIFIAPVISCWLVAASYSKAFRYWRFVQALITAVLLVFCLDDLGRGTLAGIGLFMTLINALSLLAASHFYLRQQAVARPASVVQNG